MKKQGLAIFDMDGTLLDSMPYWGNLGRNYLMKKGVKVPDDLEQSIEVMTLEESAAYFKHEFHLKESVEEILNESLQTIRLAYQFEIPAKSGMKEVLKKERTEGKDIVLLTSSDASILRPALKRTGLLSYFDELYTSSQLEMRKDDKKIFEKVCEIRGYQPEDTVVYDDALFAIKAAREAGCRVIAVYDESSEENWNEIVSLSDEQIIHHKC
ncbi:MAG: HAD family phosphatase [Lachnospiraceae bacterium]|nr:HAD family phosphatase [Lachnospiraceae bacterium]